MTNLEALVRGVLGAFTVDDFAANKVLLDAQVDGSGLYDPANEKAIDMCAIKLLQNMFVENISEGGYSVKYSRDAITARLLSFESQYGLSGLVPKPSVKDATNRW
jgi:hypothetical protein